MGEPTPDAVNESNAVQETSNDARTQPAPEVVAETMHKGPRTPLHPGHQALANES